MNGFKSFWDGSPNEEVEMETFDKSQVTMQEIPFRLAKDIIVKHHYSHRFAAAQLNLGFYVDGKLNTVISFGQSATPRMADSLPGKYWELIRLFSFDWAGKNMESYCIGMAVKHIQKNYSDIKVLISFADPEQGHYGTIYQATNWLYCGKTQDDNGNTTGGYQYYFDGRWQHPRSTVAKYGTREHSKIIKMFPGVKRRKCTSKYRYIYIISKNKKERKELMKNLKYEVLPYPKGKK